MSKTRHERRRGKRVFVFTIVALTIAYILLFAVPITKPEEQQTVIEHTTTFVYDAPVVTLIPDISTEVANKEAQMPEFGYDYGYVCAVVAAECRGEPYEGQLAVAQCMRTSAERQMPTPEEVVKLPNRYADPCTYEPDIELVRDACCDVFVHGISATDEPIEYFYSTVGGFVSEWHENNLEFVMEIGNHRFFKEAE